MEGYAKLFSTILGSTIWQESHETVRLWMTILVLKNQYGVVEASVPGLASLARISVAECEAGLASFLAPDRYSRTKDYEGRRLKEVDGGWLVLNHMKYRDKMGSADRAEQMRLAAARYRKKKGKKERKRGKKDPGDLGPAKMPHHPTGPAFE